MKKSITILSFFLLIFCKEYSEKNNSRKIFPQIDVNKYDNYKLKENEINTEIIKDTIFNDSLIFSLLEIDLKSENLLSKYDELSEKKIRKKNTHNKLINDTILIYSTINDTIKYYKSDNKRLPLYLSIQSRNINDDFLKIGITKKYLSKILKNKIFSDTVIISDIEKGNILSLYFENEKLYKVCFKINYLD
jgi:hypothetical protein